MYNPSLKYPPWFSDIHFGNTNESLDAIIAGLDLSSKDTVLAIAGSGDQAFAILEHAKEVRAIDKNKVQINYVRWRINALKLNNLEEFYGFFGQHNYHDHKRKSKRYFSKKGRLQRIKSKLGNLIVPKQGEKAYLRHNSNVAVGAIETCVDQVTYES